MLISVIIPAYNEEKFIEQCLHSVLQVRKRNFDFEVIVVDNGSTDNTVALAEKNGVKVLIKSQGYVSAVRNHGAQAAKGEILAFVDADCEVSEQWLSTAVDLHTSGKADVVGAFPESPPNSGWIARILQENARNKVAAAIKYLPACNIIVKSDAFHSVGGFNEELETNEDVDLSARLVQAGYRIYADRNLKVCHLDVPHTLSDFLRREIWHGKNALSVFFKNIKQGRNLKVVLYSLAFAFLIVFLPVSVPVLLFYSNAVPFLSAASVLVLIAVVMSWRIARDGKSPVLLFLAYDMIYGLGRGISIFSFLRMELKKMISK